MSERIPLSKTLGELRQAFINGFAETQAVVQHELWEPIRERTASMHAAVLDLVLSQYGDFRPTQNEYESIAEALTKVGGVVAGIQLSSLSEPEQKLVKDALLEGIQRKMAGALKEVLGDLALQHGVDAEGGINIPVLGKKTRKQDLN